MCIYVVHHVAGVKQWRETTTESLRARVRDQFDSITLRSRALARYLRIRTSHTNGVQCCDVLIEMYEMPSIMLRKTVSYKLPGSRHINCGRVGWTLVDKVMEITMQGRVN